jgi:hypothetical protein
MVTLDTTVENKVVAHVAATNGKTKVSEFICILSDP